MPYELKLENNDTAYLRCWDTVTAQHAHDFLSELYGTGIFSKVKFFIRDYLDVKEICNDVEDQDIATYAAIYEAIALKSLNRELFIAIIAQGEILPILEQYRDFLLEQSPSSEVKFFDTLDDARIWLKLKHVF